MSITITITILAPVRLLQHQEALTIIKTVRKHVMNVEVLEYAKNVKAKDGMTIL